MHVFVLCLFVAAFCVPDAVDVWLSFPRLVPVRAWSEGHSVWLQVVLAVGCTGALLQSTCRALVSTLRLLSSYHYCVIITTEAFNVA